MGEKERGIRDNCIKVNELWFQIKMIRVLFYKFWILCLRFLITETIRRKRYIFAAKNPDACVGDESRINKVKRIFFFTAPKKKGFFFV